MSGVAPFDFDRGGRVLVCGDGPELFVYSGANDTPLWKQFCDGILVGVGAPGASVVSVDSDGRVHWWRTIDGDREAEVLLEMPAHGLEAGHHDDALVLVDGGVVVVTKRGEFRKVDIEGVTAMAYAGDGTLALLGTLSGRLSLLDLTTGTLTTSHEMGGAIGAITWSPRGHWLVAVGSEVHSVARELLVKVKDGQPPKSPVLGTMPVQGTPTMLATNFDGVLIAADDGAQTVNVYETHENRIGTSVVYDRPLGDIAFGPGTMLGIGLEYADANRIDVMSGALTRTQAGLGRGNDPWYPKVSCDDVLLRGAVAAARAGGKPIAEYVYYGGKDNRSCLIAAVVVVVLTVLCCGCSGILTGAYYYLYM